MLPKERLEKINSCYKLLGEILSDLCHINKKENDETWIQLDLAYDIVEEVLKTEERKMNERTSKKDS